MDRRTFIKGASLALAAVGTAAYAAEDAPAKSIVAVAEDAAVVTGPNTLDPVLARKMVDAAVARAAGEANPQDAWKKLFKPNDFVGIKVNTLSGPMMSSHPALAGAVADGLLEAGVRADRIIVWDRLSGELTRAGYEIVKTNPEKYLCFGTDGRYGNDPDDMLEHGEIGSFVSPIVTRLCTAMISLPILKDHDLAGVTAGMKNFFGAIHNPNKYHFDNKHDAIADLSASPAIRRKLRLTICDATRIGYEAGPGYKPQYTVRPGIIYASTDPVALDYVGWQKIEELRKEHDHSTLAEAGRAPEFIARAAARGLGTNDPEKIDIAGVVIGTTEED